MTNPSADVTRTAPAANCSHDRHYWPEDTAEGDTCNCGAWYRFEDRIERTPEIES